jgi:hypothetical protein
MVPEPRSDQRVLAHARAGTPKSATTARLPKPGNGRERVTKQSHSVCQQRISGTAHAFSGNITGCILSRRMPNLWPMQDEGYPGILAIAREQLAATVIQPIAATAEEFVEACEENDGPERAMVRACPAMLPLVRFEAVFPAFSEGVLEARVMPANSDKPRLSRHDRSGLGTWYAAFRQ